MAVDTDTVRGADELAAKLRAIPAALRKKALRNGLAAGARLVRDAAKQDAPVLRVPSRYRKAGTVRDAIAVRTSKVERRAGNVGVFVNVRPAKGAKFRKGVQVKASQRGALSRDDPYYWQWQEFGWTPANGKSTRSSRRKAAAKGVPRAIPGKRFLQRSTRMFPQALRKFEEQVGTWFAKAEKSGKVVP